MPSPLSAISKVRWPLAHAAHFAKAMQFIMSLLKLQKHDAILKMVDLGSKLAHMVLIWGTKFRLETEFQLETTRPFLNIW